MRLAVMLHSDHAMGPSLDVGSVTVPVVGLGYTGPEPPRQATLDFSGDQS